ncbi:MAG: DUF2804 domain-containing protein [Bacilli bacterium]|nr:DUF2804 domain-containing protein [Bacilli bacterium]
MSKQVLLTKGPLLNNKGNLNQAGYAFSLEKEYNRKAIKKMAFRIKEWDYYYIGDDKYGIALTVADNSYMSLVSVSVLDFVNKVESTKSYMGWLTFGELNLPSSSKTGDVHHKGKKFNMYFKNNSGKRRLVCEMKNVAKGKDFKCDVILNETLDKSMVIATPFKKNRHFYYNQKINLLRATGSFSFGDLSYNFPKDTFGVLDWGRGVWTYSNTWYWASLSFKCEGHNVGFNLGYGFGDTTNASENMFFYDQEAYKLDDVTFNIPKDKKGKDDYLSEWTFTSNSGDINLVFTPIIDRYSNTNALIIQSKQHQVFGIFNGEIKVNDKTFKITNCLGFAEKVKNRW